MRKAFSLTIAASLAAFVAAPVIAAAEEIEEHHSSSYQSEHTTVEAPAVHERTTVETVPAPPVEQRRETETIVKKGHPHESKRKVESKTKVEEHAD